MGEKLIQKIVVSKTGASGSVYAKVLLTKICQITDPIEELGVVMTENAKDVWKTELGDEDYKNYDVKYFGQQDFYAPFASGSGQYQKDLLNEFKGMARGGYFIRIEQGSKSIGLHFVKF